jgi:hypothetical protein
MSDIAALSGLTEPRIKYRHATPLRSAHLMTLSGLAQLRMVYICVSRDAVTHCDMGNKDFAMLVSGLSGLRKLTLAGASAAGGGGAAEPSATHCPLLAEVDMTGDFALGQLPHER